MSKKKYITYSVNFITSIILFLFVFYIGKFMCFFLDDIFVGIYNISEENVFADLLNTHAGGVFCSLLSKLFNFCIPLVLNYHPGDFIMFQAAIFKALYVVAALFLMSKFSLLYSRSNPLYSCSFIFFSGYILYLAVYSYPDILISNFTFFRCFFVLLFFALFWYYIFRNILVPPHRKINNCKLYKFPKFKKINDCFEILFICFCGLIISFSMETVLVTSVFLSFALYFYNLFIKLISLYNIAFKNCLFNLNYKFYLPVLSLFTGAFIYVSSNGFSSVANTRGLNKISVNFNILKDFSYEFFRHYILSFSVYYIIFIIILIVLCICKKSEIKKMILPFLMQLSIIIGVFSLVLCGKTQYDGDYWLVSQRVLSVYALMLPIGLIMYLSYLTKIKFDLIKKFETKILYTMFLIFLIFAANIYYSNALENNKIINYYKQMQIDNYIAEKMYRFFLLKNEKPLIPYSLMYEHNPKNNLAPYLYQINFSEPNLSCSNKYLFSEIYLPAVYKDNKSKELGYCFSNSAYEIFEREGGIIKKEELENINFSRLKNDDFVLNDSV